MYFGIGWGRVNKIFHSVKSQKNSMGLTCFVSISASFLYSSNLLPKNLFSMIIIQIVKNSNINRNNHDILPPSPSFLTWPILVYSTDSYYERFLICRNYYRYYINIYYLFLLMEMLSGKKVVQLH